MPKNARAAVFKKLDNKLHIDIVKKNNGADAYCMKEDTRIEGPFEFGIKPVKRNDKNDWDRVYEDAKQGNLDAIPKDILVKHYHSITKIKKDNMKLDQSAKAPKGIWIHGKAGVGKSLGARMKWPDHYPKLCNKWWDGYNGQETVIMDDYEPEMSKFLT